jgi:hypothetical protein
MDKRGFVTVFAVFFALYMALLLLLVVQSVHHTDGGLSWLLNLLLCLAALLGVLATLMLLHVTRPPDSAGTADANASTTSRLDAVVLELSTPNETTPPTNKKPQTTSGFWASLK